MKSTNLVKTNAPKIEIGDPVCAKLVQQELQHALRDAAPPAHSDAFTYSAYGADNNLIGGLNASCSNQWLRIEEVWVHEHYRGEGLGRSLVLRAEKKARRMECHSVWLDTSSSEAARFFDGLGYEVFALIDNEPHQTPSSFRRRFLKKKLVLFPNSLDCVSIGNASTI